MDPGRFNKFITIERLIETEDADGFPVEEWVVYYSNYAYKNKLYGLEYFTAASTNMQDTIQFVMRFHSKLDQVDSKHYRIREGSEIYNIIDIDNVRYENNTVKILAVKVVT